MDEKGAREEGVANPPKVSHFDNTGALVINLLAGLLVEGEMLTLFRSCSRTSMDIGSLITRVRWRRSEKL